MSVREVDDSGSSVEGGQESTSDSRVGFPKGKTRSRKSGGLLVSLNRQETGSRTRAPRTGRSRAARLDAEIKAKQTHNQTLADELQRAKDELKATEEEVARLDRAEKGDVAATTIQSAARARRARVEVERRKLALIQQHLAIR